MKTCQAYCKKEMEKRRHQSLLGCGHLVGNVITEHSKINVGS
jgi:hypothetical protein